VGEHVEFLAEHTVEAIDVVVDLHSDEGADKVG
jgi:predicted deacylase